MATQYIRTRYFGAGYKLGPRIVADAPGKTPTGLTPHLRVTEPYDDGVSQDANHCGAAMELARRMNWAGLWVQGAAADHNVWVRVSGGSNTRLQHGIAYLLHDSDEGRTWFIVDEQPR